MEFQINPRIESPSTTEVYSALFSRYIRGYDHLPMKSGVTSNMLCLFLRYSLTVGSEREVHSVEAAKRVDSALFRRVEARLSAESGVLQCSRGVVCDLLADAFEYSLRSPFYHRRHPRKRVSERADRAVRRVLSAARRGLRVRYHFHRIRLSFALIVALFAEAARSRHCHSAVLSPFGRRCGAVVFQSRGFDHAARLCRSKSPSNSSFRFCFSRFRSFTCRRATCSACSTFGSRII